MRLVRPAMCGVVVGFTAALAACSSDALTAPSLGSLAHNYDSLATVLYAAHTYGDSTRASAAAIINVAISYGVMPGHATFNAGGMTETWSGDALQMVDSAGTTAVTVTSLWPDDSVSKYLFVESQDSTSLSVANFLSDTTLAYSDTSTVITTATGGTGSCTHVAVANPVPRFADPTAVCTPIQVTITAVLHFPVMTGIASMFDQITITSQTVPGVRFRKTHS